MKMRERDTFEDLFRSKLQQLEVDTGGSDWEQIVDRLPKKKVFLRMPTYAVTAIAAALLFLFVIGTFFIPSQKKNVLVEVDRKNIFRGSKNIESSVIKDAPSMVLAKVSEEPLTNRQKQVSNAFIGKDKEIVCSLGLDVAPVDTFVYAELSFKNKNTKNIDSAVFVVSSLKRDQLSVGKERKIKRWSFGMGGGSVTMGSSNPLTSSFAKNIYSSPNLLRLSSPYVQEEVPKTNVRHKFPISVGVGVSYRLNNRFSLHSGLNYTYLSSEWEVYAVYHDEVKQKLHFVGIPLSLSYKMAEWKDFQFYTTAGVMAEINVAGKQSAKIFSGNELLRVQTDRIRMKELLWSLNARVGVDYPLFRFLSLYAEAGVDYYIDNGSLIETIRSEKPFNVNLQAGFRFGF
ncbi:MAG: PorT family protein [Parabacteroides distasonis]|nr:PorT family protein [Parabacteroides distasonis]